MSDVAKIQRLGEDLVLVFPKEVVEKLSLEEGCIVEIDPSALILVAVIFEVVADILFKKWSIESRNILFSVGLLVYFIGTIFWAVSLKYEYLSKAVSIFTILNLIILVAVGTLLFKEKYENMLKDT